VVFFILHSCCFLFARRLCQLQTKSLSYLSNRGIPKKHFYGFASVITRRAQELDNLPFRNNKTDAARRAAPKKARVYDDFHIAFLPSNEEVRVTQLFYAKQPTMSTSNVLFNITVPAQVLHRDFTNKSPAERAVGVASEADWRVAFASLVRIFNLEIALVSMARSGGFLLSSRVSGCAETCTT
jgi:hypothetical protein